jgi:hypothetical protein
MRLSEMILVGTIPRIHEAETATYETPRCSRNSAMDDVTIDYARDRCVIALWTVCNATQLSISLVIVSACRAITCLKAIV